MSVSRRNVGLLTASVVIGAAWVLLPGCSDENASLTEAQASGGAAGQGGVTQDASAGGSSGAVTGGSAGNSSGGSGGGATGGSSGTGTGGSSGSATGGSAGTAAGGAGGAATGGSAGANTGGSLPDAGTGGTTQPDAAPDAQPDGSAGAGGCSLPSDCDDGVACTVDTCSSNECLHWLGTGCPAGKVCSPTGCVNSPICATTAQCEAQWANDPCKANVVCDGATSTCKFTVLDKDGDGHPPVVCGGDDCDDSKNTVASGMPELCDEVDNNCDGQNNEGSACPPDAPCPTDGELYDCSGSCGSLYSQCSTGACSKFPYASITLAYETDFPAVFRTPSQPGLIPNCQATCGGGSSPAAYSFGIRVYATPPYFDPGSQLYAVRVRLEPPYQLHHTAYPDETSMCGTSQSVSNCVLVDRIDTVFIFTEDPYAPATNVTFELIPWGMGMCK